MRLESKPVGKLVRVLVVVLTVFAYYMWSSTRAVQRYDKAIIEMLDWEENLREAGAPHADTMPSIDSLIARRWTQLGYDSAEIEDPRRRYANRR